MVHIKKLELKGFKSFNKKQEIEFNKGLEIFIGSNGSGKSNIKDAISFVLGKLSSKDMRVDDFSKLVFHGGKGVNPAKRARVKLKLDNSDELLPVDSKSVTIQREVGKNGRSTYRINGGRTTREKILNLLAYAKIEPGGYNIINQGQVARFVKLKPEERLDIIKDISGIGKYEKKKEKTLDELEEVEKREEKAEVLLNEKEKRLEELRKEKEKAEEYLEIKRKVKENESALISEKLKNEGEKLEKIEKEIERKENKIEKLGEEEKSLEKEIEKVKEKVRGVKEKREKVKSEIKEIDKKIQKKREKEKEFQGSKNSKKEEIKKLEGRVEKDKKYINRLKEDIEQKEEKKEELKQKLEDKKEKIGEEDEKTKELSNELQEEIEEINEELFQLQVEKEKVKKREEELEEQKEIRRKLENKKKIFEELRSEVKGLGSGINTLEKEKETKERELEKSKEKLRELKRKERLTENFRKKGVRKIKELKSEGKLNGVRGTVSELAKVDDEYSLALRVAASGRLNNIVVENEDVGSKCINALKREKSGIATFLPLNKIERSLNLPNPLLEKEGAIGFAINLLDFDEEYRDIFSYILSSTLIVEDFEAAKRIGIGEIRMVTLEGDLVSRGGSMTGGSRKEEDYALGFKAKGLKENIEKTQESISVLKEDLNHLKEKIEIKKESLIKKREEKARLENQLENLNQNLDEEIEEGPDLNEIEKREEGLKEEKGTKKEKLRELEVSSYEKRREELNKIELELEETNTAVEMKEDELENSKDRLESSKNDLEELKAEIEDLGGRFEEKRKEISSLKDEKKGIESRLNKINKDLKEIRGELNGSKQDKVDLEEKIKTLKQSKNRNLVKKKEIETKLENLEERKKEFETHGKKEMCLEELEEKVQELKERLEGFGKVNMKAIDQFDKIEEEFKGLKQRFNKIKEEKEEVLGLIEEIEGKKKEEFLTAYDEINNNFSQVFKKLTSNGEASLVLENEEEPLEDGIRMNVRPSKKKKLTSLRALSGGEKSLTTLAFIFAIQEYDPAPFYVLDEIDAALDKENSRRLANLLEDYSRNSQFILISHNDHIIKKADHLFGVAMNERGESQIYSVNLEE